MTALAQARALAAADAKRQADASRRSVTLRGRWGSVIEAARNQKTAEQVTHLLSLYLVQLWVQLLPLLLVGKLVAAMLRLHQHASY